jgi:hypothetical protein
MNSRDPEKANRDSLLRYHFDEVCQLVLRQGERVSLEELQRRWKDTFDIKPYATFIARRNREIEAEHGIAPLRVTYELNPEYVQKVGCNRKGTPRSWNQILNQVLGSDETLTEEQRLRIASWAGTNKQGNHRTIYQRICTRLLTKPEVFLTDVFSKRTRATAEEIASQVPDFYDGRIKIAAETVVTAMDRYIAEGRGPPYLERVDAGVYQLSNKEPCSPRP